MWKLRLCKKLCCLNIEFIQYLQHLLKQFITNKAIWCWHTFVPKLKLNPSLATLVEVGDVVDEIKAHTFYLSPPTMAPFLDSKDHQATQMDWIELGSSSKQACFDIFSILSLLLFVCFTTDYKNQTSTVGNRPSPCELHNQEKLSYNQSGHYTNVSGTAMATPGV